MVWKDLNCLSFFFGQSAAPRQFFPHPAPCLSTSRRRVSGLFRKTSRTFEHCFAALASLIVILALTALYDLLQGAGLDVLNNWDRKILSLEKYLKMWNSWNLWKKLGVLSQDSSFSFCLSNFSAVFFVVCRKREQQKPKPFRPLGTIIFPDRDSYPPRNSKWTKRYNKITQLTQQFGWVLSTAKIDDSWLRRSKKPLGWRKRVLEILLAHEMENFPSRAWDPPIGCSNGLFLVHRTRKDCESEHFSTTARAWFGSRGWSCCRDLRSSRGTMDTCIYDHCL